MGQGFSSMGAVYHPLENDNVLSDESREELGAFDSIEIDAHETEQLMLEAHLKREDHLGRQRAYVLNYTLGRVINIDSRDLPAVSGDYPGLNRLMEKYICIHNAILDVYKGPIDIPQISDEENWRREYNSIALNPSNQKERSFKQAYEDYIRRKNILEQYEGFQPLRERKKINEIKLKGPKDIQKKYIDEFQGDVSELHEMLLVYVGGNEKLKDEMKKKYTSYKSAPGSELNSVHSTVLDITTQETSL